MISVAIAVMPSTSLTFAHTAGASQATFTFPIPEGSPAGTKAYVVTVMTDGTTLRFFPERSAGHREVLKTLGITA